MELNKRFIDFIDCVQALHDANQTNAILIKNSVEYTNLMVAAITKQSNEEKYQEDGQKSGSPTRALVDCKS